MATAEWQLEVLDWGLLGYGEASRRQKGLVAERIGGSSPDRLVLVEHPPVITIGRSGGPADLRASERLLREQGVGLHRVDRGGLTTFHGPGQLVAYPIIRLRDRDLHAYLERLLGVAGAVLRGYGLEPERREGRPGLWVAGRKIASVGIAVRRWVTYHGLALNVSVDPAAFGWIVPCGDPGEVMTSMERELGRSVTLGEVKQRFTAEFVQSFEYSSATRGNGGARGHPDWLVRQAPRTTSIDEMEQMLGRMRLATVCQSAHCPNLGECFNRGTATFMILGTRCTRSCRFCAVEGGVPAPVDPEEPERVARAAATLGLRHVVVTSVTRDDLADGGAGPFEQTVRRIRARSPEAQIEVLVPDFGGSLAALQTVCEARPDVLNHNVETVPRLYAGIRPKAWYRRSLSILEYAARQGLAVKSGLMLGLGETDDEAHQTLIDLRRAGCRYLTLGQYLAPSRDHAPVARYVPPEEFESWAETARSMGFEGVAAGPLVRSSYRADEMWKTKA